MFDHIQDEVNARIEAFVAEIADLARDAARETLSATLGGAAPLRLGTAVGVGRRSGGKRTPEEITRAAEALYEYIATHPGERMEAIAAGMASSTQELSLPVKKLLSTGRIRTEGQKRATSYYPVTAEAAETGPVRRRRRKRAG
ncbi:hypothetical protein [Haliangium sp.]|uniref:hypothetical protein n=1 Tax=Haliangium sp. TaxID=2663208 RepID=UPI003D0DEF8A